MNKINYKYISQNEVHDIIKQTNGKLFSVKFYKKDGSLRTLNGRLGVTKHLHGGSNTTSHIPEYINVYDVQSKGYRKVNVMQVTEVISNNICYIID